MEYQVNRGVGQPIEVAGLRGQYIWITLGGIVGCFLLYVVLNLIGLPSIISVGLVFGAATLLIYVVFHLSRKYGPHGLMKLMASKYHPHYLSNRKRVKNLLRK